MTEFTVCPHFRPIRRCLICKAEAVASHFDIKTATGAHLDELMKIPVRPYGMTDEQVRARYYGHAPFVPPDLTATWPRAIAIVALRRIVDRAVSDELHSPATADILRIALLALNQLEDEK